MDGDRRGDGSIEALRRPVRWDGQAVLGRCDDPIVQPAGLLADDAKHFATREDLKAFPTKDDAKAYEGKQVTLADEEGNLLALMEERRPA